MNIDNLSSRASKLKQKDNKLDNVKRASRSNEERVKIVESQLEMLKRLQKQLPSLLTKIDGRSKEVRGKRSKEL